MRRFVTKTIHGQKVRVQICPTLHCQGGWESQTKPWRRNTGRSSISGLDASTGISQKGGNPPRDQGQTPGTARGPQTQTGTPRQHEMTREDHAPGAGLAYAEPNDDS